MNFHQLRKCVVIVAVVIGSILCYKYFFKSWSPYYQEKLYKEPRPLLVQALQVFNEQLNKEKKALDLGAGAGNDTAFLLKNGWQVWANDKELQAIQIISMRTDIEPYQKNLTLIHASFTDLPWNKFPLFDLVYAGYALPFIDKDSFAGVWHNIVNVLEPQGILAVHFFGAHHEGFNWWEKRSMNFFTKEEIVHLLKGFKIIVLEESADINERGIMDHSFSVIAQKLS